MVGVGVEVNNGTVAVLVAEVLNPEQAVIDTLTDTRINIFFLQPFKIM